MIENYPLCKTHQFQCYLHAYVIFLLLNGSNIEEIVLFFKNSIARSSIQSIIAYHSHFIETEIYRFLIEGAYENDYPIETLMINQKKGDIVVDLTPYYAKLHTKRWSMRKSFFLILFNLSNPKKVIVIKCYFNHRIKHIKIPVSVQMEKSMLLTDVVDGTSLNIPLCSDWITFFERFPRKNQTNY